MKLAIIVVTPNRRIADFVGMKKIAAIPRENRTICDRNRIILSLSVFLAAKPGDNDLTEAVGSIMPTCEGLLLLCDKALSPMGDLLCEASFLAKFDGDNIGNSVHNFLGPIFSRSLKNYGLLFQKFCDLKYRKLLLLPLKNFEAKEMQHLDDLFAEDCLSPEFANTLDEKLGALYNRRTPKTDSRYNRTYVRDDRDHFFNYADERHAQLETGVPPHGLTCAMKGNFRFGVRYDSRRHFNVSAEREKAKISAEFIDCHGNAAAVREQSHVNMFPNGFF